MAWINTTPAANEAIHVRTERYWQAEGFHSFEVSNGISSWTNYENAVFRVKEVTTEYRGLTESQANTTAAANTAAPTYAALLADGSSIFESHSKKASAVRANECGGYNVVVVEKWTALYVNGSYVRGASVADVS
jgi:hypothetical protein